jgi:hypothetical protein
MMRATSMLLGQRVVQVLQVAQIQMELHESTVSRWPHCRARITLEAGRS